MRHSCYQSKIKGKQHEKRGSTLLSQHTHNELLTITTKLVSNKILKSRNQRLPHIENFLSIKETTTPLSIHSNKQTYAPIARSRTVAGPTNYNFFHYQTSIR